MKIYRAWTDSNHKLQYQVGYFFSKDNAQKVLNALDPTGSSPPCGIEEIEVSDSHTCVIPNCKVCPENDRLDFICAYKLQNIELKKRVHELEVKNG
jgi:hypothetical protein